MEIEMNFNKNQVAFIKAAENIFGVGCIMTRDGIQHVVDETGAPFPYWFVTKSEFRAERGRYKLPDIGSKAKVKEVQPEPEAEMALSAQVAKHC